MIPEAFFPLMESLDRQSSLWDCTVSRCFKNSKLHKLHKSWGKPGPTHQPHTILALLHQHNWPLLRWSVGRFGPRKVLCNTQGTLLELAMDLWDSCSHRSQGKTEPTGPGVPRTPHTTWSTSPTPCYIVKCSKQGSRRSWRHSPSPAHAQLQNLRNCQQDQVPILRKAPGDSDPKTCARLDSSWCWIPDKQFHWPHEQHLRGMLLDILSGGLCTKGFVVDPCSAFCHRHSAKVARPHRHTCAAYLHMKHCRWKRDPAARTSNTVCSNRQYLRILRMHCFHPQRSHQSQHTTSVPWMLPSWVAFDIFGSDECRDGT